MTDQTLQLLLSRLDHLTAEFHELREGVSKAVRISNDDPEMALTRARKVLEYVVRDVFRLRCKEDPGTRPLENLLQRLVKDGHMPKRLGAYASYIRDLGNVGTHSYGEEVSKEDVRRSFENLTAILEWYFERVRPDAFLKAEDYTPSPPPPPPAGMAYQPTAAPPHQFIEPSFIARAFSRTLGKIIFGAICGLVAGAVAAPILDFYKIEPILSALLVGVLHGLIIGLVLIPIGKAHVGKVNTSLIGIVIGAIVGVYIRDIIARQFGNIYWYMYAADGKAVEIIAGGILGLILGAVHGSKRRVG
ncbi:MAG: DUF4145 domain-containing protein [Pyrinomonadaceae bacterium]